MAEDLVGSPFTGSVALLQPLWPEALELLLQLRGSRLENIEERPISQQSQDSRGVGIGCGCHGFDGCLPNRLRLAKIVEPRVETRHAASLHAEAFHSSVCSSASISSCACLLPTRAAVAMPFCSMWKASSVRPAAASIWPDIWYAAT